MLGAENSAVCWVYPAASRPRADLTEFAAPLHDDHRLSEHSGDLACRRDYAGSPAPRALRRNAPHKAVLFTAEASHVAMNPVFQIKMVLIAFACSMP